MNRLTDPKFNILILAPMGQDAKLAAKVLLEAGFESEVLLSIEGVCKRLENLAGALLITEEAITNEGLQILFEALKRQDSWSDLPIILVTSEKKKFKRSQHILDHFGILGNISLLERPFSVITLSTMVKVALRSRERQYQIHDLIQKLNLEIRSKDDFLSVASHELKTPMTALKLQVDLRRRQAKNISAASLSEPESKDSFLDIIDRQVNRISILVDDMLDISRIEHGKLSLNCIPCDLREIVRHSVQSCSPMLKAAGIKLEVEGMEAVEGVWDRYRIEQVVTNLVTNAIKYGEDGPILIRIFREIGYGKLSVCDTGPGVSLENRDRIFERFERVSDKTGGAHGLGLGLFISRQIAEIHGGTLTFEVNHPKGAIFTLALPLEKFE